MPKGDKQAVLADATRACSCDLRARLEQYPRTVILALGNAAVWSVTGWYDLRITKARGNPIQVSLGDTVCVVIPAIHPAALLRGTGTLTDFKRDVNLAARIHAAGGDISCCAPRGPARWFVVDDECKIRKLIDYIRRNKIGLLGYDIEGTGLNPRTAELLSMAVYIGGNKAAVLTPEMITHPLWVEFMQDRSVKQLWHNGKFDVGFLRHRGVPARTDEDTMLLSYCLNERGGYHGLEVLSANLLHEPPYKDAVKQYIPKGGNYGDIPKPILYEYNARDARNTGECFTILREEVRADRLLERLYVRTLIPASELLTKVERNGFWVDKRHLLRAHRIFKGRIRRAVERFHDAVREDVGESFVGINHNSPLQVYRLLFGEMKLHEQSEEIQKWLKLRNKLSTEKEVLKRLSQVPVVKALRKIRRAEKLHSTYVKGCFNAIDPTDQRVHATYLLHGTTTGRLASREPNLQNIPREALIKAIYAAPPGRVLVEADYNQAELRVLAVLSKAPWLLQVYEEGRKLHDEMSVFLFGANYTHEDKMRAKAVNFGIPYGREAVSIASEFGVSPHTAQEWIDDWFRKVPEAKTFLDGLAEAVRRGQSLATPFGNMRRFESVGPERLHAAQNEARNFPMQAIASHCTLHAAIKAFDRLYSMGSWIVNLVHDSIIVECDDNPRAIEATARILKVCMEVQPKIWLNSPIDFPAEFKVGPHWGMNDKDNHYALTV
jgi:DNA polymerase-1